MMGVSEDVKASMFNGLIPGADNIQNKAEFQKAMDGMGDYIEVQKFEPRNYLSCGSDVYFNVDWEFIWKPSGKAVSTTAIVRKKMTQPTFGSKSICEKYHLINAADVKQDQKKDANCTIC